MRAMFMVVASILVAAGLFGCNEKTEATATVASAVQPAPAAALPPPPPALPEPARRLHRLHRVHYASRRSALPYTGGGHVSRVSYAQMDQGYDESGAPYDGDDHPGAYGEEDDNSFDGPPPEPVWVDGHGRPHYDTPFDGDRPAESPDDSRARRSPWHGWNSDCDKR